MILDLFRIWFDKNSQPTALIAMLLGVRKPKITTILVWDHENLCLKGREVIMMILIKNAQNREREQRCFLSNFCENKDTKMKITSCER